MRAIPDDNLAYPVQIRLATGASGSGFFLNTGGATFLATARHVLFDDTSQLRSDVAYVSAYSRDLTDPTAFQFRFDLPALEAAGELRAHPTHDAAVVLLGRKGGGLPTNELRLTPHAKELAGAASGLVGVGLMKTKRLRQVLVANEIIVFGYPAALGISSLAQIDPLVPLLRRGIVAGRNERLRTLILDCPVHPGNSGGPVLEVERKGSEVKYRVIGLISELVPTIELGSTSKSNSGFSIAVPIDILLDLI
jgi:hypothetical protein